ncbi:MAG TPA: monofunctional biosynthetic peptidoglycan transglycosylase [Bacteroidia bacterium]|nr:monofunctional biosynthetic peptidoglycan transglycosylase [Bacteroidia bacterium]
MKLRGFLKGCLHAATFFICFSLLIVLAYKWMPVPWTPLMFIRAVQDSGEDQTGPRHDWVKGARIPNNLQLAVVCAEDQNFLKHHGFDFEQIQHAMEDAEAGKRVRGASTISQQTAKNIFLWPTSSWARKGFEVWFTFLIELFWSKERIMTVYLNSIEFGKGVYGCEAASKNFFKKSVGYLNDSEAARLAAVLPNPHRLRADKASAYLVKRQRWVLRQMQLWGGKLEYEKGKKPGSNEK